MEDQEQLAVGFEHDTLAQAMEIQDRAAVDGSDPWFDRTQQKRRCQTNALHLPPNYPRTEGVKIQQDVR
jgi:hypothetical protein